MKILLPGALLLLSLTANAQIRRPFKSDPPIMCSSCAVWNRPLDPVTIFGNTYYVGTERLSSVLITSDRGHILLDGALPQSAELIDRNIRHLGFKTEDIRLIVSSHAHFDHAGGIHALQQSSGATVAASAPSADELRRGEYAADDPQYGFGRAFTEFPAIRKIKIVKDGQTLRVGSLAITAHLTPGHTPGSTTWTWRSCEGPRCLDVVYADSLTASTAPGFKYSSEPARVLAFRTSIATVAALPCDIIIAVHPEFTNLLEKIAKKDFVDPNGCREYSAFGTRSLEQQLASE